MKKYMLMTMLIISSVAVNGMDAPNGRAANLPMTEDEAFERAIALSAAEETRRQYQTQMYQEIEANQTELAVALSRQNALNPNNKPAAQPKQYDLTNPLHVIAWAEAEGNPMTYDQALAFADEQQDALTLELTIMASCEDAKESNATAKKTGSDSEEEVDECFHCLEDLDANVVSVGPNCKHKTHSNCLTQIKARFTECPVCNANL